MNDVTIHHSIKAVNVIINLSLQVVYLPAYRHNLVSVEKIL